MTPDTNKLARDRGALISLLRAMAINYMRFGAKHCFDHLDADACMRAADALDQQLSGNSGELAKPQHHQVPGADPGIEIGATQHGPAPAAPAGAGVPADSMTPRELARRLKRGEKWKLADAAPEQRAVPAEQQGAGDAAVARAINSKDLYQVLLDVQNGIDSPALASMANGAIRLIDKARAALAARQPVGQVPVPFSVESPAFEVYAKGAGLNMEQHPLHYLFLDPKTNAARQAWKAALQFAPPAQAVPEDVVAARDAYEAAARRDIEAWLDEHAPGYPDYSMEPDGGNWAFWVASDDATSYLHTDTGLIEWYGTGWPHYKQYDPDTGVWRTLADDSAPGAQEVG